MRQPMGLNRPAADGTFFCNGCRQTLIGMHQCPGREQRCFRCRTPMIEAGGMYRCGKCGGLRPVSTRVPHREIKAGVRYQP